MGGDRPGQAPPPSRSRYASLGHRWTVDGTPRPRFQTLPHLPPPLDLPPPRKGVTNQEGQGQQVLWALVGVLSGQEMTFLYLSPGRGGASRLRIWGPWGMRSGFVSESG